jgi:chromosome segregation ATPase
VTTARLLPIINAAGCLVLVGFIFFQWFGGKVLNEKLHGMEAKLIVEENARVNAEFEANKLQKDIEGLKASIDSIRKDSEANAKDLEAKSAEVTALNSGILEAQTKVKEWEDALKARDEAITQRDEKIKELNATVISTRKRLDEAIDQLKKAGAR